MAGVCGAAIAEADRHRNGRQQKLGFGVLGEERSKKLAHRALIAFRRDEHARVED